MARKMGRHTMDTPRVHCSDCGSEAKIERGTYRFKESGLDNVVLKGIEIVRCPECGNEDPIIPNMEGMLRTLAFALIKSKLPLSGPAVRYLRKYVGMTGEQFARMLHTDKTTVSKWETGSAAIGSKSDLLIRSVALLLIKSEATEAEQIVREFEMIDEESTQPASRIEVNSETLEYAYS